MENEIDRIITFGSGEDFLEINNNVGQRWYFPYKSTKKYLSLFRPSSAVGKVIRLLIPVIKHITFLFPFLKMKRIKLSLDTEIKEILENVFNKKHLEYAIFCGSPGKHRKTTIMVSCGNNILGYCKATDQQEISALFKKEKEALEYLHEKGIEDIPFILFCDNLKRHSNICIYIQTTTQEKKSENPSIYSKEIIDYINEFNKKTVVTLEYKDTDYYHTINSLKKNYPKILDKESRTCIEQCIIKIDFFLKSKKRDYTFSHGDFTPWNCLIANNKLFAFDFEYCYKSFTPYYDLFHFYTQSCIYDRSWDNEKIYKEYKKLKNKLLSNFIPQDLCDFYYQCYLVGIIGFYLTRENGVLNERIKESIKIWISIIKRIENEQYQ